MAQNINQVTISQELTDEDYLIGSVDNKLRRVPKSFFAKLLPDGVESRFSILEGRMNTFTELEEGSTTGDAELQDIRTGADGKKYSTAGEAVRKQISAINSNSFKYYGMATTDEDGVADLNNLPANTAYLISLYRDDTDEIANMPDGKRHGTVLTFGNPDGTGRVQIFSADSGTNFYIRQNWGNNQSWKEWKRLAFKSDIDALTPEDIPLATINETAGLLSCFLNVGCIGDSLASGESVYKNDDGSTGYADLYKHSWGQYLARMTGNTYYNWSSGGRTTSSWLSSSYATQCFDGQHKCEAYIIGLGQNDRNQNITIGTLTDIDKSNYENNSNTYYGNYGKIIQKIKEMQPKAKIFVLTDPQEATETKGYNTAVRTISTLFDDVYLVDLYTYGKELYSSGIIAECNRSGHYNAMAYREMALIIASYIDWIMRHNVSDFSQIEFIGTEYAY